MFIRMYVHTKTHAHTHTSKWLKGIFHCKSYACSDTHAYSLSRVRKTIRRCVHVLVYIWLYVYTATNTFICIYVC